MKLINADKLLEALGAFTDENHGDPHFLNGIETVREIIEGMSEEVVRCGDCEYYTAYDECTCPHWDIDQNNYPYTDEDDYCSYGERRTDDAQ